MLHKKTKNKHKKTRKTNKKTKPKKTNNCRCTSYLDRAHSGWLQYHRLVQMNHVRLGAGLLPSRTCNNAGLTADTSFACGSDFLRAWFSHISWHLRIYLKTCINKCILCWHDDDDYAYNSKWGNEMLELEIEQQIEIERDRGFYKHSTEIL